MNKAGNGILTEKMSRLPRVLPFLALRDGNIVVVPFSLYVYVSGLPDKELYFGGL